MKSKMFLLVCVITLLCGAISVMGQEPEDVVRIKTRVIFVNAHIKDKKTNEPVKDLVRENFVVLDNGKPRALTYFSNEGSVRQRPLALVLVLNLPLYVEKPEVMEQIISALGKLQPEDEVAIMQIWAERGPRPLSFIYKSKMVLGLTHDREKTYAALREVQKFAHQNMAEVRELLSLKAAMKTGLKEALKHLPDPTTQDPPFDSEVAPDFEKILDIVPVIAAQERPASQVVVIESTDDDSLATFGQSKEITKRLMATGVTYNALITKRDLFGKFVHFTGHLIAPLMGMRYEMTTYYSKQTGGEVAKVSSPESFAASISQIINNLTARYSLGFTLEEGEKDDGRMHRLEVKVKARDARGKQRKLVVSTRRGYYMSAEMPGQPARPTATEQTLTR